MIFIMCRSFVMRLDLFVARDGPTLDCLEEAHYYHIVLLIINSNVSAWIEKMNLRCSSGCKEIFG